MPMDRTFYVAKGRREPTQALMEQADYSCALANKYRAELIAAGFGENRIAEMAARNAQMKALVSTQSQQGTVSKAAYGAEQDAIDDAKRYLRKLRYVAPIALRDLEQAPAALAPFTPKETLARRTSAILKHLQVIRPSLEQHEALFTPFFGNESPLAVHDRVTAALTAADATQEVARGEVPQATQELNEVKGRLLEGIEDMNRIGIIAFEGRADIIALFNKDILLRGRGTRQSAPKTAAPAA